MKYDILTPFKKYLKENLNKNTAKTYYAAVEKLFKDVQFNNLSEIEKDWVIEEARKKFTTLNEFSAAKNGLKWLAKFSPDFTVPSEDEFKAVSSKKRNFSRKPKKVIYLKPTQRKINQISNLKLKYAYRLSMISGLRVSELADLEAKDIAIKEGKIYVTVRHGKGGHGGVIECRQDDYLVEHLPEYLNEHENGKIFYSEVYMREHADKLGIECHDLRRIFAINTRNELKKELPAEEANAIVQDRMRHERFATTKRYLFNRKLKMEYEKAKPEEKDKYKADVATSRETQSGDVHSVGKIDKEIYKCITEDIVTDEVVITDNQIQHIKERHPNDYERFSKYFSEIVSQPDYIIEANKLDTAVILKKIVDNGENFQLVLRVCTSKEPEGYKNSIITFLKIDEKRWNRYLRTKKILYKKE